MRSSHSRTGFLLNPQTDTEGGISSLSRDLLIIPTVELVGTSLLIYFIFIKITHSSSSKKARPALRGLRERSTELWDVYDLRFSYLVIYVDNLDFYIHMSSHTLDLSVVLPSTVVCGLRGKPVRL